MTQEVEYRDGDTLLTGKVFRPSGDARAAIAVFPTIMNPTPAVEAKARALAEAGFLAFLCDFYGETPANFAASVDLSTKLRSAAEQYRRRLRAGIAAMGETVPGLAQGAIGFCMGGQAVLELAREGADLEAVASFHGLLDTKAPAEPGKVKARILVCHGDADPLVPREQVIAFWEEMDRAGANWHFHSYSRVVHGFTNPKPPPSGGPPAYDASADRQSWSATMSLFDEVFS
ncbi:Dienelactone hydrolase family protein [Tsuneonella dongtanensis]|uniref:Dienelactone hydrolase family protein n=1 Tax=Tsuneonella dongtanensis TaxID=692370 RepID=A0A1B2AEL5_9SPHN|nr:dienelactone hydrolase family protein [Tsuneonella dongtanensis]ANY20485.1 Dienelactone hydrolase family protein [Tsuneonella dongtanensis]